MKKVTAKSTKNLQKERKEIFSAITPFFFLAAFIYFFSATFAVNFFELLK